MNYKVLFCKECEHNYLYYNDIRRKSLTGDVLCYHKWLELKKNNTIKYNEKSNKTESVRKASIQIPKENNTSDEC